MWKFLVKQQKIEVLEREVIANHQIAFVNLKFVFDGDWKKFHKVVQFSQCDETYSIVLGFDGTTCHLPAELHVGAVKMSVFGYDAESDMTIRATTVPVTLNIRESGFVGDDDTPIPPTPDLYTQLLQKIAEIKTGIDGKDGLSAYEIAKENGFVGTVAEWLESLKGADGQPGKDGVDGKNGIDGKDGRDGADGRDGVDGVTPDMSQYPTTSAIELIIQKITNPLSVKSHEHENQSVLDEITASYTLEEQRKLAEIQLSDYATKKALADEAFAIREAMIPLTRELHSHENMAVLDMLTAEQLTLLDGLQQFEDSTKYDIQTIKESVEPVISQAHWHHNLTTLNSITAEKITKWDNYGTQINGLSTRITVYSDLVENSVARIGTAEVNIENLQKQIDALKSGNIPIFLFCSGQNAMNVYAHEIGIILNGDYHMMTDFVTEHPHFCSAENDYALSYSQDDFGWDAQILTVCTKAVSLTEKSGIMISYLSGATENGSLYLVPKPEKIDVPVTIYVSSQINAGGVISLNFKWLQSESFITTVTKCDGVSDGEYFLAWVGRSNNTHPIVKRIQVLN
ncbi:hypothetical protein [Ruminococcus sp.]|uniref:hypothetical protein n=1 Tax=Ruminococcus sp. TaxID=41978 RepID=UPI0025D66302|nr:hypothetical protein [Ruminococcus sp.]